MGKHCEAIFLLLLKQKEMDGLLMEINSNFIFYSESVRMAVLASGANKIWTSQEGGFQNLSLCSAPSGVRNGVWQGSIATLQTTCFQPDTLLPFSSSLPACGVTSYSKKNKKDFLKTRFIFQTSVFYRQLIEL